MSRSGREIAAQESGIGGRMNTDMALSLVNDALWTAVLVGAPVLTVALVIGLLVSILQVVTQIQEMTLTFVPKIMGVALVILVLGHWMLTSLTNFAASLYSNIPAYF